MIKRLIFLLTLSFFSLAQIQASYILIPMDAESQKDHLKAYGITYWVLKGGEEAWWLLNYRGGSFAFPHTRTFEKECLTRGVSYEIIADGQFNSILEEIGNPEVNMEAMRLEKAPEIAVYTPDFNARGEKIQPWDDAEVPGQCQC